MAQGGKHRQSSEEDLRVQVNLGRSNSQMEQWREAAQRENSGTLPCVLSGIQQGPEQTQPVKKLPKSWGENNLKQLEDTAYGPIKSIINKYGKVHNSQDIW